VIGSRAGHTTTMYDVRPWFLFSSRVLNSVCLHNKVSLHTAHQHQHHQQQPITSEPKSRALHLQHISTQTLCRQRCVHGPSPQRACAWSHMCDDLQESLPAIQQRRPLLNHPLKRGYSLSSIVKTSLWLSNRSGPIQIIACAPHVACAAVSCSTNGSPLPE